MNFNAQDAYQLCNWLDTSSDFPPSAPPPSGWSVVFAPAFSKANYAVILENTQTNTQDANQLAIVIMGTHYKVQVLEDFQINKPGPFVNSSNSPIIPGAYIANGAMSAFQKILNLTPNGQTQTLEDFLESIPWLTPSVSAPSVLITGHSLGGTIASIMGPWLASLILEEAPLTESLPPNIQVITFAAFAGGNLEFAEYLNNSSQYEANINVNDIVPYVWATTGDYQVNKIYTTFRAPGPPIPESFKTMLQKKVSAIPSGFNYIQTNKPNIFTGTILAAPPFSGCKPSRIPDLQWEWELGLQHNYAYCQQYIGSGCTQPRAECPKDQQ